MKVLTTLRVLLYYENIFIKYLLFRYGPGGRLQDWWTQSTLDLFTARAKNLENQYSNLSLGGSKVDGHITMGENIADNGGMKVSYSAAFPKFEDGKRIAKGSEGLGLTLEQLFFVSYAQVWCNANTEEYEVAKMESHNPHPPSKLRVEAVVANSEPFAKAFKCPNKGVPRSGVW